MKNVEDEPRDTNNAPNEDFVDPHETRETVDKKLDAEVSGLFEDARGELEKIDANAERQKKEIVIDLAKDLEGKIPTDTICMEIIGQLRGQVKERTVRACLDEKYKQKSQSENAKKQNRQQQQEVGSSDHLAAASMPPNQEAEKKKAIILDVDGRAILQEEEEDDLVDEGEDEEQSAVTTEHSTTKDGVQTNHRQEQQEEPKGFTYSYDYLNMKGPGVKDVELDEQSKESTQSIGQDEVVDVTTHNDKSDEPEGDILDFEFSMVFKEIRNYMTPLFSKIGDSGKVWFSGKIDIKTGRVVHAGLGRISERRRQD